MMAQPKMIARVMMEIKIALVSARNSDGQFAGLFTSRTVRTNPSGVNSVASNMRPMSAVKLRTDVFCIVCGTEIAIVFIWFVG